MLGAAVVFLLAQAPGSIDADGNLYFQNGTGRYPLVRKGIWKADPATTNAGPPVGQVRATAADLQTLQATLEQLSAIFRATPEADALVGYWMRESRRYRYPSTFEAPPPFPVSKLPIPFSTGFYPFYLEDRLKGGQYIPVWGGETDSIYFEFNSLPGSIGRPIIAEQMAANEFKEQIYLRPRVTAEFRGLPVYEGRDLVITRAGRDPWSSVPFRRALEATAKLLDQDRAAAEARLADLKKKNEHVQSSAYEAEMRAHLEKYSGSLRQANPSKWEGRVKGMERELLYNRERAAKDANPQRDEAGSWYWNPIDAHARAAEKLSKLTVEESTSPACLLPAAGSQAAGRYALRGSIEKAGSNPDCQPLVETNFAYFEPKLPRSTPQILVVQNVGRCGKVENGQFIRNNVARPNEPSQGCAKHPIYWEQLDWNRVRSLLAP